MLSQFLYFSVIAFTTTLKRFDKNGEKTGWTYIDIPAEIAQRIKPGTKKIFRVKGKIDAVTFQGVSLMPMGGGDFIMPVNATLRKSIRKNIGAPVKLEISEDTNDPLLPPADFLACLQDEPSALEHFGSLPSSHRRHYVRWIIQAKTETTRTGRIADAISALAKGIAFGEMLRSRRKRDTQNPLL